jgi:hypothetical protein
MKSKLVLIVMMILFYNHSFILGQNEDLPQLLRFPFQDSTKTSFCQSQPLIQGNEILIFYSANNTPQDTILLTRSSDNGQNWSEPIYVSEFTRDESEIVFISGTISNTGRMLVVFSIGEVPITNKTKIVRSDNNGLTWSIPQNVIGVAYIPYPKITQTSDGRLWIVGRNNNFFTSTNNGDTWAAKNLGFSTSTISAFDFIELDSTNYLTTYDKYDSNTDTYKIYFRKSSDAGSTWSSETIITETDRSERRPSLFQESNGTIWLVIQNRESTPFSITYNIYQENISYRKSSDNGVQWSSPTNFTAYLGYDGTHSLCSYNNKPLITFLSDRWYGNNQIWIGQLEVSQDNDNPPVLYKSETSNIAAGIPISIRAFVEGLNGIQTTELLYKKDNSLFGPFTMFDDGNHNDGIAGDNIWGLDIGPFDYYDIINTLFTVTDNNSQSVTFQGSTITFPAPPVVNKWLSVGSLHNWYSSRGSEIEEGFIPQQQYGLQWNAIAPNQDIQASKGFWIGAADFTDQNGSFYPHKVVHTGPRVNGEGQFYSQEFKMVSQFEPPIVYVNGNISYDKPIINDEVDPNLIADRVIINSANTQLGITMTRKIFQFGQSYNENYIISGYTFKNTGNVDADSDIELPNTTLNGVYFYYLFRSAICANTRYAIGNGTGWGMNTMIDTRGDGVMTDPPEENFRAQYVWHGKFPPMTLFDNIGGPIWSQAINVEPEDTVGRLGASQFAGVVTLHADISSTNNSDDISQPKTTSWEGSDDPLTSQNDPYNIAKMTAEYGWMSKGHRSPRHAYEVEPTGLPGFLQPTNDPALGTPGGFTFTNGYGPYTLAPGDSVTIVFAEAVSGISRELATSTGIQYKQGQIDALQKNTIVFQSRDSLFQTFRNAILNYQSGYSIPKPPKPPFTFSVNSDSISVSLSWTIDESTPPENFRIYRASSQRYNTYQLIAELPSNSRSFVDSVQLLANTDYYYYLSSVGEYQTGGPATPPGRLESNRFYTQTYNPVQVDIGTHVNSGSNHIYTYALSQNYPNPFNPSTSIQYAISSRQFVTLKVFDLLGREVATLVNEEKPAGSYNVEFRMQNLELSSGIYFYKLQAGSFVDTKKMILLK